MLFNSYEYIIILLPAALIIYFLLNKYKLILASKIWLIAVSIFFYGWWNVKYIPLLLGSIVFNYLIGSKLAKRNKLTTNKRRRGILILGVTCNVVLLAYFKYPDFMIANINYIAGLNQDALHIILPLGISFFTFTQIAYLVDTYNGIAEEYDPWNYSLFVTFFPHLLSGC